MLPLFMSTYVLDTHLSHLILQLRPAIYDGLSGFGGPPVTETAIINQLYCSSVWRGNFRFRAIVRTRGKKAF